MFRVFVRISRGDLVYELKREREREWPIATRVSTYVHTASSGEKRKGRETQGGRWGTTRIYVHENHQHREQRSKQQVRAYTHTRTYVHTHAIFHVCVRAYLYYTYIFVHKARFTLAYQSSDAPSSFSPFLRLLFLCRAGTIFHPFYHSTTLLLLLLLLVLLPHCSPCLSFYSSFSVHPVFLSLPQGHSSSLHVDESQTRPTAAGRALNWAEGTPRPMPRFFRVSASIRESQDARETNTPCCCCCCCCCWKKRTSCGEQRAREKRRKKTTRKATRWSFNIWVFLHCRIHSIFCRTESSIEIKKAVKQNRLTSVTENKTKDWQIKSEPASIGQMKI